MDRFKKTDNGFNYIYEKSVPAGSEIIVKMPVVSANKRGINDIGWQSDGDLQLYGTISSKPESSAALWQEIIPNNEVNKTISAIKIKNNGSACKIAIRAILY